MIDIGFGDSVEPGLVEMDLPVMLDFPAPHLRAYARETVIAEKFQAMVMLGRANSRMKDFYDVWVLSRASEFTDDRLARAIAATFARRNTEIPSELLTPDCQPHPGVRLADCRSNLACSPKQFLSTFEGSQYAAKGLQYAGCSRFGQAGGFFLRPLVRCGMRGMVIWPPLA